MQWSLSDIVDVLIAKTWYVRRRRMWLWIQLMFVFINFHFCSQLRKQCQNMKMDGKKVFVGVAITKKCHFGQVNVKGSNQFIPFEDYLFVEIFCGYHSCLIDRLAFYFVEVQGCLCLRLNSTSIECIFGIETIFINFPLDFFDGEVSILKVSALS